MDGSAVVTTRLSSETMNAATDVTTIVAIVPAPRRVERSGSRCLRLRKGPEAARRAMAISCQSLASE